jgi:hypothetical protein
MAPGVERLLDRLLSEEGVVGYSVKGEKVTVYVESEEHAERLRGLRLEGCDVEVRVTGRLRAL